MKTCSAEDIRVMDLQVMPETWSAEYEKVVIEI